MVNEYRSLKVGSFTCSVHILWLSILSSKSPWITRNKSLCRSPCFTKTLPFGAYRISICLSKSIRRLIAWLSLLTDSLDSGLVIDWEDFRESLFIELLLPSFPMTLKVAVCSGISLVISRVLYPRVLTINSKIFSFKSIFWSGSEFRECIKDTAGPPPSDDDKAFWILIELAFLWWDRIRVRDGDESRFDTSLSSTNELLLPVSGLSNSFSIFWITFRGISTCVMSRSLRSNRINSLLSPRYLFNVKNVT